MKGRQMVTYGAVTVLGAALILLMSVPMAIGGESASECSGPACSGPCAVAADDGEQARLREMVDRQREELVGLTRAMAAEKARQTQLESELAAARAAQPVVVAQAATAPEPQANTANLEEENRRLRMMLDVERDENEQLAAKLRAANKVADLVFRSEQQGSSAVANSAPAQDTRQEDSGSSILVDAPIARNVIAPEAAAKPGSENSVPPGWRLADAH